MIIDFSEEGMGCVRTPRVCGPGREFFTRLIRLKRQFSTERVAFTVIIGNPHSVACDHKPDLFVSYCGKTGAHPRLHREMLRPEMIGEDWMFVISFYGLALTTVRNWCPRTKPTGSGTTDEGDNMAKDLEECLAELKSTKIPMSSSRRNVLPEGHSGVRSCLLGAYSQGGSRGVTSLTKRQPRLTQLLTKLARDYFPEFPFNAITINSGYSAKPHVDRRNEGPSMIVALGDFRGGRLWIRDDKGTAPMEVSERFAGHAAGQYNGTYHNIHNNLIQFSGKTLHAAENFTGERYSVIWFNTPGVQRWTTQQRNELVTYGFNLNDNMASNGALPKKTEDLKNPIGSVLDLKNLIAGAPPDGMITKNPIDTKALGGHNGGKTRCIIEVCANADSYLGQQAPADCEVIRITEKDDLLSESGFRSALSLIRGAIERYGASRVLIWVSTPCTGGTSRHAANVAKYARRGNIEALVRLALTRAHGEKLLCAATRLLQEVAAEKPGVAWEWPLTCAFWQHEAIRELIKEFELDSYQVHGCMVGIKSIIASDHGAPMKKPWRIASNWRKFGSRLDVRCDGTHQHAACQGRANTRLTERYTTAFAQRVHDAFRCQVDGENPEVRG